MSDSINTRQSLDLDPATARAASVLWKLIGSPKAVVSHFIIKAPDGTELKATPAEVDAALARFRGHSDEQAEAYLSRLASTVRSVFR
jgi:hypothetical protein